MLSSILNEEFYHIIDPGSVSAFPNCIPLFLVIGKSRSIVIQQLRDRFNLLDTCFKLFFDMCFVWAMVLTY